jgi:hypothetical protein
VAAARFSNWTIHPKQPSAMCLASTRGDRSDNRILQIPPKNNSFTPLDVPQKPYYCGCKGPHVSAALLRRRCPALHRPVLPVYCCQLSGKHRHFVGMTAWSHSP